MPRSIAVRLVIAVALATALSALPSRAATLEWRSFETGSAEARATNKTMLLDFWADWCVNCAAMDAQVFTDAEIHAAMRRLVPVRIDIDRKPDLSRKYGIQGVPAIVVTDAFGNELFRHVGQLQTPVMLGLLRELPADVTEINRLSDILAKDDKNVAALHAMGRELRASRFYLRSNVYLEKALRAARGRGAEPTRGEILLMLGDNHLELRQYPDAARAFERYQRELPGGPREPDAMLGLARALLAQQQRTKAEVVLKTLTTRHPSADVQEEAARLLAARPQ